MTKPLKPWERKGYRFSIDWPPGFVCQPYEPPYKPSPAQIKNLRKGAHVTNALTGRKFYGKTATHDNLQGKKAA